MKPIQKEVTVQAINETQVGKDWIVPAIFQLPMITLSLSDDVIQVLPFGQRETANFKVTIELIEE